MCLTMIVLNPTRLSVFLFPSKSEHISYLSFRIHGDSVSRAQGECPAGDELNQCPARLGGGYLATVPVCDQLSDTFRLHLTQIPKL